MSATAHTPSSPSNHPAIRSAHSGRQLVLLLVLWWRHMRRRATRIGDSPKVSGVPTFLLINLISMGYIAPLVWRAVTRSMSTDEGFFAWHMGGVLLAALGNGVVKGASGLQLRATRNDAFLEPLPLAPIARLGLQLVDGFFIALLALVVPFAGSSVYGGRGFEAVAPAVLGVFAYVAFFVVGCAAVACARSFGPPTIARRSAYAGIALNLVGMTSALVPLGRMFEDAGDLATLLTRSLFAGSRTLGGFYVAITLLLFAAYRALLFAERRGFDRVTVQANARKALKGAPTRARLEWHMMWRQGGRALLIASSVIAIAFGWLLVSLGHRPLPQVVVLVLAGFGVYLGAIQTIAQAGNAARGDLTARPFLCALPLSPHEVLDGKARALRTMLAPILLFLLLIAGVCAWRGEMGLVYRTLLAMLSLVVAVDGAISLAFLSTGVGVIGVGGGQASSSFSTQLLMIPLMTTVMAANAWAASVSVVAVVAVTREARRAAKLSVRWLDDSDDVVERETTVWRALLAATTFFAMQVLSARLLDLFEVPAGFMAATSFGISSLVLVLLTWRNNTRFDRPRFLPLHIAAWPLGAVGGCASGFAALRMADLFPSSMDVPTPSLSVGESVALFVTLVVTAPLAEEYFFRGWLQKAIEKDLPDAHKRWSFVLGSVAFALAHVGSYGVPQLVLGLVAGALYALGGGLWPAILAHAVHNGVVLLMAR